MPLCAPVRVKRRLTPVKLLKPLRIVIVRKAEFLGHGQGGRGIQRIVVARHGEAQVADVMRLTGAAVGDAHREARLAIDIAHVRSAARRPAGCGHR